LIFEDIAALEKALLPRKLDPLVPLIVGGVFQVAKRRDDFADSRGYVPEVLIELVIVRLCFIRRNLVCCLPSGTKSRSGETGSSPRALLGIGKVPPLRTRLDSRRVFRAQ
jgi:hypothetical protein